MTIKEQESKIKEDIKRILGIIQRDPSEPDATEWEDGIRIDFIEFVQSKHDEYPELAALARLALSTREIDFTREWEKPELTSSNPEFAKAIRDAMDASTLPEREKRRIMYRGLMRGRT